MFLCNILVINCGSLLIKFVLVNEVYFLFFLYGFVECLGSCDVVLCWKCGGDSDSLMIFNVDYCVVFVQLLLMVQNVVGGKFYGIGYWVVYGGELFIYVMCIDDWVVEVIWVIVLLVLLYNLVNL